MDYRKRNEIIKRNKMNETATPRTDKLANRLIPIAENITATTAQTIITQVVTDTLTLTTELERELTAVTEQRDRLLEQRDVLRSGIGYASDQLIKVTEQRDRLAEIYPLLAAAWFYGSWKAETFNERKMQEIMEREKWWPWESEDKLLEALQSLTPNADVEARQQ